MLDHGLNHSFADYNLVLRDWGVNFTFLGSQWKTGKLIENPTTPQNQILGSGYVYMSPALPNIPFAFLNSYVFATQVFYWSVLQGRSFLNV